MKLGERYETLSIGVVKLYNDGVVQAFTFAFHLLMTFLLSH